MLRRRPLRAKSRLKAKSPLSKRGKSRRKKKDDADMERLRPIVIERDKGKCILCGKPYQEIHHIKYRSACGKSALENLCCLCWHCHRVKIHDGIHPKEYRKALQGILKERYGYEYEN